jgi:hypothetical protein
MVADRSLEEHLHEALYRNAKDSEKYWAYLRASTIVDEVRSAFGFDLNAEEDRKRAKTIFRLGEPEFVGQEAQVPLFIDVQTIAGDAEEFLTTDLSPVECTIQLRHRDGEVSGFYIAGGTEFDFDSQSGDEDRAKELRRTIGRAMYSALTKRNQNQ